MTTRYTQFVGKSNFAHLTGDSRIMAQVLDAENGNRPVVTARFDTTEEAQSFADEQHAILEGN